jgi:UDP-4-amino-4,6-dideoxy-N-acetyl-beta-L-altrosamine N-acetyltransferase
VLKLIRLSFEHLEKTMHWRMLPEVTKYLYTDPQLTFNDQVTWFRKISKDPTAMYWIINFDGNDIGVLYLYDIDWINSRCGWAYYIGETGYRGSGIGSNLECNVYDFVFKELKLNKLWCEVLANNQKVIELHKKYGSEIEGVLKEHIIKQGKPLDVVRMGITKNKWMNIRNQHQYKEITIEW